MANKEIKVYAIRLGDDRWFINKYSELWHTSSFPLANAQAEVCSNYFKEPCKVIDLDIWWHDKVNSGR